MDLKISEFEKSSEFANTLQEFFDDNLYYIGKKSIIAVKILTGEMENKNTRANN